MPDPSPKQNPTESASAWQRAARVIGATVKLLIGVPALIFTVLAPVLLGMRVLNDQPVILPINVPPELSESGFTESVVAKRLIDAMSVISQEATSYIAESSNLVVSPDEFASEAARRAGAGFGPGFRSSGAEPGQSIRRFGQGMKSVRRFGPGMRSLADEFGATVQLARPDISVPGTGTSLDIIANYIREFLQRPNEQIHGEITKTGAQVELHLRFGSWSASYPEVINSYPKPDDLGAAVGRLLKAAALGLTEQTNPDIAAAVYLNRKAPAQAAAMVARALSTEPVVDDALAYCLWAELDIEQQGATPIAVQQAVRKYQAALKIKPDMPEIYFSLANVLRKAGQHTEADAVYRQAFALLRDQALPLTARDHVTGDEAAQVAVGLLYESAVGVTGNLAYAAEWYRRAANHGYAEAQFHLGRLYELSASGPDPYDDPDADDQAVYWYQQAAEQGYVDAQFRLASLYDSGRLGRGEEQKQRAVYWYARAADQKLAAAQNDLGVMYSTGKGVPQADDKKAFRWFKQASDNGDTMGMLNLALMYKDGRAVRKDYVAAALLLRKSADLGNAGAMNQLAWYWASRRMNLNEALQFAKAAVDAEPRNGAYRDVLGWIYYQLGEYAASIEELKKAVRRREWQRYEHLGDAYAKHDCPVKAFAARYQALEILQSLGRKSTDTDVIRIGRKLTRLSPAAGIHPPVGLPAPPSADCV